MTTGLSSTIDKLKQAVGQEHVLIDEKSCRYFSQDLSLTKLATAAAVVQPGSTAEVAEVVKIAAAHGLAVVPRGGGMSYTMGYMPRRPESVLIDTRRMSKIVEINTTDMYVTVEAGCTWAELNDALQEHNVRTPFWGPFSGLFATVGGGLGQNCTFHGASRYGTMADSVLAVEVVTGTGEVLQTGAGANEAGSPFFRYFGPDLTGLFIADAGALGVKTKVTMRLVPAPPVLVAASFAFKSVEDMITTQAELGRLNTASELYSMDRYYHESFAQMGFTYLRDHDWSLHFTVDEMDETAAKQTLGRLKEVAGRRGQELEDTLPLASRAVPFVRMRSNGGRLILSVHTLSAYSKALSLVKETQAVLAEYEEQLTRHDIRPAIRTSAIQNAMVIEPLFYWRDEFDPLRLEGLDPDEAETFVSPPANLEGRQVVFELRERLSRLYFERGGVAMQLGKFYDLGGNVANANWALLKSLKQILDPQGLMNPGALGLD